MKVAFVIPFAFERYFHDVKSLFPDTEKFENEIISKRNTWHFNWCNAMKIAGMEVKLFHISGYGKAVREYKHFTGVQICSVPTTYKSLIHRNEISYSLLKEIDKYDPDIIFSVTHMLDGLIDMYDILIFYFSFKGHHVIARNPGADSYDFIFSQKSSIERRLKDLRKKNSNRILPKTITLSLKWLICKLTSNIKFFIKRKSLHASKLIIPQTNDDFNGLVQKFHLVPSKLILMPKPINTKSFYGMPKNQAAKKLKMDAEFKYLLHVSNLYGTKGCENIIEIMPELIKRYDKIALLITGGGSKKCVLSNLIKKMHLEEKVILLGQVENENLVLYYNIADVFVLPTDRIIGEGIPNVILESIACNTPPISTNIPGPAALISDDLGLLVEVGNRSELFESIVRVLDGNFRINQIKRNEFLKNYSLENVGKELKSMFYRIIAN